MRRTLAISSLLGGSILTVALLFSQAAQAQSWQATVSAQSKDMGHQALAFLPNEIWIHPGDSITWTFAADEIHTVTFLSTIPSQQIRPRFQVGCPPGPPPGTTPDGSSFDGDECVNSGASVSGQTYTVTFPTPGNYKLACLVHANMTAVVHVLPLSEALPHNQDFYDDQAADERSDLLSDVDHERGDSDRGHSHWNQVTAGVGKIVATGGGSQTLSVVRFMEHTKVVHVGETVEWTNSDPVTPHTITFGIEPANPMPPSANVTVDVDGARHAVINSTADSVHSGVIVAAPQERNGLAQSPLGVTRFRITFKNAGTFPYICALHDNLGMKGEVIVLP
jgi:plastocyanin